jgi:hypothetical protein
MEGTGRRHLSQVSADSWAGGSKLTTLLGAIWWVREADGLLFGLQRALSRAGAVFVEHKLPTEIREVEVVVAAQVGTAARLTWRTPIVGV